MPGFDQEVFNNHIDAKSRKIDDLIKEMIIVRQSTIWLFDSMDEVALQRQGSASELTMSALAIAFMITGHLIHHVDILEERYYPLFPKSE